MKHFLLKIKRPLITSAMLILVMSSFYLIGQACAYRAHVLTPMIENDIPFIKEFIYLYIAWYPMLIIVPCVVFLYDNTRYSEYVKTVAVSLIISVIIFIIFPTDMPRADSIDAGGVTAFIVNFIYSVSSTSKCIPSIHCLLCFEFMLPLLKSRSIPKHFSLPLSAVSLGIIVSTLFVKQHLLCDIFSALGVAVLSNLLVKFFWKSK